MKVTSNIPQVADAYFKQLEKQVDEAVLRSMKRTGIRGETRAKAIIEKEAYDTGQGLRSVTHEIDRLPDQIRLALFAAAEHMYWQEVGRKAGKWPNLDALTKWTGRKLREKGVNTKVNVTFDQLKALAKSNGKKATAQQKAYRQHLGFLYIVGKKIATRGIRGKRMFKRLENELLEFFRSDVQKELNAIR